MVDVVVSTPGINSTPKLIHVSIDRDQHGNDATKDELELISDMVTKVVNNPLGGVITTPSRVKISFMEI